MAKSRFTRPALPPLLRRAQRLEQRIILPQPMRQRPPHIVIIATLQVLYDVTQQVRALRLAARVDMCAGEVHVQVVELRVVVDEDPQLLRAHAVHLLLHSPAAPSLAGDAVAVGKC